MRRVAFVLFVMAVIALALTACSEEEPTPTAASPTEAPQTSTEERPAPTTEPEEAVDTTAEPAAQEVEPEEDPLYLSIIWHQHQPVYFKDPADGKDKLVGAVAYGWSGQKDPLCGIQPITQMLASGNTFSHMAPKAGAKPEPEATSGGAVKTVGGAVMIGGDVDGYLAAVLDPNKADFGLLCMPRRPYAQRPAPSLVPLTTPLMVSGISEKGLAEATRRLGPFGIMPVMSGGINADVDKD